MMYANKLVVCLKSEKGTILREYKDTVFVNFGEQFSLYFKNLNSVRASISISIDGKNVFENGATLVVNPNSDTTVERWVTNSVIGNRFKFIQKTGKISKTRGDKAEDGLIRVAVRYEKLVPVYAPPNYITNNINNHWPNYPEGVRGPHIGSPLRSSGLHLNSCKASIASDHPFANARGATAKVVTAQATGQSVNQASLSAPLNDKGITVDGAISHQKFNTVYAFPLEAEEHVIVLRMLGELGQNKPVDAPVVVKRKVKCPTCGTTNKGSARFCSDCGTAIGAELVT